MPNKSNDDVKTSESNVVVQKRKYYMEQKYGVFMYVNKTIE